MTQWNKRLLQKFQKKTGSDTFIPFIPAKRSQWISKTARRQDAITPLRLPNHPANLKYEQQLKKLKNNKSNKLNFLYIFCKGEQLPRKLLLHKQNDAH